MRSTSVRRNDAKTLTRMLAPLHTTLHASEEAFPVSGARSNHFVVRSTSLFNRQDDDEPGHDHLSNRAPPYSWWLPFGHAMLPPPEKLLS